VLQRLDDPDLLAHAPGVVADRPPQRRRRHLEPLAELGLPGRRPAGELAEVVEQVLPGHRVVERDAARQVARPGPDRDGVANDVEAHDGAAAGAGMEEAQ
jgi:hypothetical protein